MQPLVNMQLSPSKHNIKSVTFTEYLSLPIEDREERVWWWFTGWFKYPWAMTIGTLDSPDDGWNAFDNFIKKHYPVQYYLREVIPIMFMRPKIRLNDFWRKLQYMLKHPRAKMRDKLFPPGYQDLDTILTNACFAAVVEFVEEEKCFEVNKYDYEEYGNASVRGIELAQFKQELQAAYSYITKDRADKEAIIDAAFQPFTLTRSLNTAANRVAAFKSVNKLIDDLEAQDTKLCLWVITNRQMLWT